jgi:hypothetical protein
MNFKLVNLGLESELDLSLVRSETLNGGDDLKSKKKSKNNKRSHSKSKRSRKHSKHSKKLSRSKSNKKINVELKKKNILKAIPISIIMNQKRKQLRSMN